ncbi:MAG TPA: ATP-binding cassette domain-containing protein [Rhizomicrobium sp.]|jgi:ABC-type multidrug transport system ATPase subunit|nr:ATP-binding cassette domain-containing protein [Rhizomicrobium sp.]
MVAMRAHLLSGPKRGAAGATTPARVPVDHNLLVMRRDETAAGAPKEKALYLDHPTVSRCHARFVLRMGTMCIEDLGSTNGTWVNSEQISHATALKPGDHISIGTFILTYDGSHVEIRSHAQGAVLGAYAVCKQVRERAPLYLLRNVTLELPPRELVCVIGASGSGKTTLMNVMSGRNKPSSGTVKLGRFDVHECFSLLKQDIAYVPQSDPLHEFLTLRQALAYSARLRLPADMSVQARDLIIADAAQSVGLEQRLNAKISTLSGGERKRASLATEILSRPNLLFLDEVTSGLDESTDREIMQLLKQLVGRGMTIVCVTHTLANIEDVADAIIVMGEGGLVTFCGSPVQLRAFFGIRQLGQVFETLAREGAQTWHERFESAFRVRARAPAQHHGEPPQRGHGSFLARGRDALRQFAILTARNLSLVWGDRRTLTMAGLQSLIVGALLGFAFADFGKGLEVGSSKVSFLVVLGITCIWIGCAGAAKAIVGELPIYLRERDINLSTLAFVLSKFLVTSLFAVCQVLLLIGVSSLFVQEIPGAWWEQFLLAALAAVNGVAIGLIISAVSNSRDQAAVVVPLALAPQLIFGSGMVSNLSVAGEWMAKLLIGAYWSRKAMTAALIAHEHGIMKIDPVAARLVPVTAPALGGSIAALLLQTLAWLAITMLIMHVRHGRKGG